MAAAALCLVFIGLISLSPRLAGDADAGTPAAPPAGFKVAFIGDSGIGPNAEAVLQLIADESADMVMHVGDFGYSPETDPQTAIDWDAQITSVLGADYPYFGAIGNHDVATWSTYQQLLEDRLALVSGASCSGEYGVEAICTYEGLYFLLSGVGTHATTPADDPDHLTWMENALASDSSIWSLCAWHKNQTAMQVGGKPNEVGWGAYETCRDGDAIIATAHEHSYSRTKTLIDMVDQTKNPLWPDADEVMVGNGNTFAFVSGLGGQSIRHQKRCLPATPPYGCNGEWASIYTNNQGATDGALFIEFHVDGDPYKAHGYFKNVDDIVVDDFTIWAAPPKVLATDTDGDGCTDEQENGADPILGGQRDYLNQWDFYDVAGMAGIGPDGTIDLANDILAVVQHYAPTGSAPYNVALDRGPIFGEDPWDRGPPDGVIDLPNDILGVIQQFSHHCA